MKKSIFRSIVVIIILLAIITCFCACSSKSYDFEGVKIPLPKGFSVERSAGVYIAYGPDYPDNTDNITFVKTIADDINNYTEEALKESYASVNIKVDSFDKFERWNIDGNPALYIEFGYTYAGIKMKLKQLNIFLEDRTVTISYTDISGEYTSAFDESIKGIQIK